MSSAFTIIRVVLKPLWCGKEGRGEEKSNLAEKRQHNPDVRIVGRKISEIPP